MCHYFDETSTSQNYFYVFSKVFMSDENLNLAEDLNNIDQNYDILQQESFLEFWRLNGDFIAADEYWRKEGSYEGNLNTTDETGKPAYNRGQSDAESSEINALWYKFYESIYTEQFQTYATIFYEYYQHLRQSLQENIQPKNNPEVNRNQILDENFVVEFGELELFGLPTAFGRSKKNLKKHSIYTAESEHIYSGLFSDDENECINMELEDETNLAKKTKSQITKTIGKKKKNRKLRNIPEFLIERKGMLKYWRQRFSLFSRYDDGIRLDCESWFSVTPEKIAIHLANRLRCDVIIDAFCGCGGNAIQFAHTCNHVIAIDIDPVKLNMAKHNATIYGVANKIDFINGDFLQMSRCGRFRSNVVFLSPPWGGPQYKKAAEYDIEKFLQPCSASELIEIAKTMSENVVFYLPRNSSVKQVIQLAGKGNQCELEHNYLDSRLVAITALYGDSIIRKEKL